MTIQNIDWNLYRSFLAVLETGSLSLGANFLKLSQPTIGRHIDTLEQMLGYQLFLRSQRGLVPTAAAISLKPFALEMRRSAEALERMARSEGHEFKGVVRISASEMVAVEILPILLAQIAPNYREIEFEIVADDNLTNLIEREADIAIRMVEPKQKQLLVQKIGNVILGAFASEDYLKKYGTPNSINDAFNHKLIGFDRPFAHLFNARGFPQNLDNLNFNFRADSNLVQLALIKSGAGIGVTQTNIGYKNGLIRVLEEAIKFELDCYIAMHEDLKPTLRFINIFRELQQAFRNYLKHNN